MKAVIDWLAALIADVPLALLEVWGRCSYVIGFALALFAFGGFTFRVGSRWGLGRERQAWDAKAVLSIPLTFVAILVSGYLGSFIVLVPGAQTFESLKDLIVFLAIVLLGYPALITVPLAYALSDLIEGVPPDFLLAWLPGYFINPACFWLAYQLIGKDPDFRRARTWLAYLLFVAIFMAVEPVLWGYICSDKFTSVISYQAITPALFFTTGITWLLAPFAMLLALPLARRSGLFWAEISGHVRERALGQRDSAWEAGAGRQPAPGDASEHGLPIRIFILGPFIALVLLMVGATASVTLHSAADDANRLAGQLHEEIAQTINLRLDEYLERMPNAAERQRVAGIGSLLSRLPIARHGLALIVDRSGGVVSSSSASDDPVTRDAVAHWKRRARSEASGSALQFRFDHVTSQPLSRETWLVHANPYRDRSGGHEHWTLLTATPESFYLAGVRAGKSRSAMVFAVALLASLAVAALLASIVAAPLRRIAVATRALAGGDLGQRVPSSGLDELRALAVSFNRMAAQLEESFDDVREHRDHLEQIVQQRTLALHEAKEQADAANRAKSTFLASMSHEIRTPMNAVLGFGQLMEREADLSPRDRDWLSKMLVSGRHLLQLINNVLEMSKMDAGRQVLNPSVFALQRAIADVDAMARREIEERGLSLAIEGVDALPRWVETDAAKLRQVLLNLLGNAAKFTKSGRIVLRASAASAAGDQVSLRFEVEDTGAGIANEELERVFEPFEQTASGLGAQTGTGLGMPISRGIARLMGGDLTVRSALGVGTTFVLQVRVRIVPAEEAAARASVESASEGSQPALLLPPRDSAATAVPAAHLTRARVAALGDETVSALRRALETGYVDSVPALLAGADPEHAATVSALCRLAADFEIEALIALL